MQAPKLPSFFKSPTAKYFSFKPRYYNERKPLVKRSNTIPVQYLKFEQISAILGVVFSLDGKESEPKIDLSILNDPKQIRTICEEYANAGVERLIEFEKIRDSDNPISEYEKSLTQF